MAKPKIVKRVVTHPRLYLAVKGKLQLIKRGTVLELTAEQAATKAMQAKTADPKDVQNLNLSGEETNDGTAAVVQDLTDKLSGEIKLRNDAEARAEAAEAELAAFKKAPSKKAPSKK